MKLPSEHEEQVAVFEWAAWNVSKYPELESLFAVDAAMGGQSWLAKKRKKAGVKAGILDIFLDVPKGSYHGLRIELKKRKGGKISEAQKRTIERLNENGYFAQRCNGADETIKCLEWYLGL